MGKQKRSENTYTKINTVFYRDENNIIMPFDNLVMPELEWLRKCKFDATEKIDGTNIRIEVTRTERTYMDQISNTEFEDSGIPYEITWHVEYKGKTDSAQVPKMLMKYLQETYPEEKVLAALGLKKVMAADDIDTIYKGWVCNKCYRKSLDMTKIPSRYTLYGEGYGAKIQACGSHYLSDSNSFIGFDVKVDDQYLLRHNMLDIFNKLGCPTVPYIGQFTIDEAIDYVRNGFVSNISEDKEFLAEGLVLKSPYELTTRDGVRICFKIKTCDWVKYFFTYGTYDKVEQKRNPKIS